MEAKVRRPIKIMISLSEEERDMLEEAGTRLGLSRVAFIRSTAISAARRLREAWDDLPLPRKVPS